MTNDHINLEAEVHYRLQRVTALSDVWPNYQDDLSHAFVYHKTVRDHGVWMMKVYLQPLMMTEGLLWCEQPVLLAVERPVNPSEPAFEQPLKWKLLHCDYLNTWTMSAYSGQDSRQSGQPVEPWRTKQNQAYSGLHTHWPGFNRHRLLWNLWKK